MKRVILALIIVLSVSLMLVSCAIECSRCGGTGKCDVCKGTGSQYERACDACNGTGECPACLGDGKSCGD